MEAISNAWYVGALGSEVSSSALVEVTMLEQVIMLFRGEDGSPKALSGICPHRFARLSAGKILNGAVECPYHGLQFGTDGQCVHNPRGSGTIPPNAAIRSYPAVESAGMIWVWMGEADNADPATLPRFDFVAETPPEMLSFGYMQANAGYQIIIDNLVDPSHADWVHESTLTSVQAYSRNGPQMDRTATSIGGIWSFEAARSQPIYHMFQSDPEALTRQRHEFRWHRPSVVEINVDVQEPGRKKLSSRSFHAITPIDAHSAHYWFAVGRDYGNLGPEFNRGFHAALLAAFETEDKPVLEGVDRMMAGRNFWEMRPLILEGDQISVLVRRETEKWIRADPTHPG